MKNGDNLITLFFFLFIGTFLYKCIQSLRMRNWGIDWAWRRDPNALWDTKVRGQMMTHPRPPPVQSVRARTGRGQCVCWCVCRCVCLQCFFSSVCPTGSVSGYSQRQNRRSVFVCVSLSRWEPQSMTWHILHGAFSKSVVVAATGGVLLPNWWPSRKLQLSFFFLSSPVTRSL